MALLCPQLCIEHILKFIKTVFILEIVVYWFRKSSIQHNTLREKLGSNISARNGQCFCDKHKHMNMFMLMLMLIRL